MNPDIQPLSPRDCSPRQLADFADLVRKGDEVEQVGLEAGIGEASKLVFLRSDGQLAGIAAIKNPDPGYRNRIAKKASVDLSREQIPYELGWIFIEPTFQGNKRSRALVSTALEGFDNTGVFATARSDNDRMLRTLARFGFHQVGCEYSSNDGKRRLRVLLRPGNAGGIK